jgi:cytochrome c
MAQRSGWLAGVVLLLPCIAVAQIPLPTAMPPADGPTLFAGQCGTCHTLNPAEPPRQGPLLRGVYGRRAGSLPGFAYSAGLANAGFNWDSAHLDRWLSNPQAMIPGAMMLYHQADPAKRALIINWLKEQR